MSFELNRIEAFKFFATQIQAGAEGCFFSCDDKLVGKRWAFGYGQKTKVENLESSPQFSVFDFEGKTTSHISFEHYVTSDEEPGLPNVEWGNHQIDLEAVPVESDHFLSLVEQAQSAQVDGQAWVINGSENFSYESQTPDSVILSQLFLNFLNLEKSHCGGVLLTKEQKFCSLSPEVFIQTDGHTVETFPIKGTGSLEYLESSKKEAAELTMITDLMRNDLGQISSKVEVVKERFFREESHFYHAFAHVRGVLESPLGTKDYLALLPAGSISGAPKRSVVDLINKLERFDRRFFTGTFGAHFDKGDSIYGILIRTLFAQGNGQYDFPVGVGITIESTPQQEWEELLRKRELLHICSRSQNPLE